MASFIEFFHKNGGFGDNDAPTNVAQALLQGFFGFKSFVKLDLVKLNCFDNYIDAKKLISKKKSAKTNKS